MNTQHQLDLFNKAAILIDGLYPADELKVGIWLDSVVLKIQRKTWLGNPPVQEFKTSVFFSIWVSDEPLKQNRLYYNIHSFKLRNVKGYQLTSRDFAERFRKAFKPFENEWPNVSTQFGPLTLMQGWVNYDENPETIAQLAKNFTIIEPIIADLFHQFRKI